MPKIFCFIFARGGSQRVPNKNLQKINKQSLLAITLKLAKKINKIDKIFVSSDSNKILNIAKKNNTQIIKRPKFLCHNNSNEFESWKHSIQYLKKKNLIFDFFLSLPTTTPLRKKKDIMSLIKKFSQSKYDLMLCVTKTNRFPHYNMVIKKKNTIQPILKKTKGIKKSNIFDLTTVGYITKPEFIMKSSGIFDGKVGYINVPRERAIDIDDFYDLKVARFLLNKKNRK